MGLLLLVMAFSAIGLKAQDLCEISCNVTLPVCSQSPVTLSVPNDYTRTYLWSPGGQTTASITVYPFETTTYSVVVSDENGELCTSDPFTVTVLPRFTVDFRQIALTCSNHEEENGRTAQVVASVDSASVVYEPPFTYEWQNVSPLHIAPGNDAWAIGLEAYKYYKIKVTDNRGCIQYDSTTLKAYANPKVEITADPGDTVYLQNPHVTFSFENREWTEDDPGEALGLIDISNFYWILESQYGITSSAAEPRFTYVNTGDFITELKVYNPEGCDTSYFKTIKVNPVKLKVPNVFTPNGDGVNDYFIISLDDTGGDGGGGGNAGGGNRDGEPQYEHEYDAYDPLNKYYESTQLTVFNRWGRIVFSSNDYQNDWDGDNLPDGTYFYVLKCRGLQQDATYQGSVMIFRGSK